MNPFCCLLSDRFPFFIQLCRAFFLDVTAWQLPSEHKRYDSKSSSLLKFLLRNLLLFWWICLYVWLGIFLLQFTIYFPLYIFVLTILWCGEILLLSSLFGVLNVWCNRMHILFNGRDICFNFIDYISMPLVGKKFSSILRFVGSVFP